MIKNGVVNKTKDFITIFLETDLFLTASNPKPASILKEKANKNVDKVGALEDKKGRGIEYNNAVKGLLVTKTRITPVVIRKNLTKRFFLKKSATLAKNKAIN